MSYLDYAQKQAPTGLRKVLHLNWPIILLVTAVAAVGFLMLFSIAGGKLDPWARPQMERFAAGMVKNSTRDSRRYSTASAPMTAAAMNSTSGSTSNSA